MKNLGSILVLLFLLGCSPKTTTSDNWEVVLKTDKEGVVLEGSKAALMNAIRAGADIKIGWGGKRENLSIEHLSVPIWLAILSEKEVMAHLDPQVLSGIDWDGLNASYEDASLLQKEWRVVLTTKGDFDAVWYDIKADTLIRRWPQKHRMTWFAKGNLDDKVVPLFD